MKTMKSLCYLLSFLWTISLSDATPDAVDPVAKIRHNPNSRPQEWNVDAKASYNDKFMSLMESPCRPETDGYFGSTYGDPVQITYGFKLEAQPLSSVLDLLDVVEDRIVDGLLSRSFPEVCGFRRRRLSHASGYRFFQIEEAETCNPTVSPVNFCAEFKGQVNVYGRDPREAATEVLTIIDEVLNPTDPSRVHPALEDMALAQDYFQVAGNAFQAEQGVSREALGWAGMVMVIFIFLIAVYWFFILDEREEDSGLANKKAEGNKINWKNWFKKREAHPSNTFLENNSIKSIKPTFEEPDEAVAFGGGDKLLLTDGRPVQMEFDDVYIERPPVGYINKPPAGYLDKPPTASSAKIV